MYFLFKSLFRSIFVRILSIGTMPGWLFTYGHVLGVAYNEVSFPYFHIAVATGAIALPTLTGVVLRRFVLYC